METLYKKLKKYSEMDYYPFHMPGHKRNCELSGVAELPYQLDITEIEGFDDLHHARGILLESEKRAAELYYADETHFLVNGSTVGILSAVLGLTHYGEKILVARNCHKSVYHAVEMNALRAVYIYPEWKEEDGICGEISAEDVRKALVDNPGIKAVVIVSPTYDGVVSDIRGICRAAHEFQIPLIVDEAHGAHFGFDPYFPKNSCECGADVVIHSLHKTLPSLTQTALIHMNGQLADRKKIRHYLHMLQSSSPSYILLSSIDSCLDLLARKRDTMFSRYTGLLEGLRSELNSSENRIRRLRLIETENYDRSKLVISCKNTGLSGPELGRKLLKCYHLQVEMVSPHYVLAMTSPGDTKDGYNRLTKALLEIDRHVCLREKVSGTAEYFLEMKQDFSCQEALQRAEQAENTDLVLLENSGGRISAVYVYLYPPGCPFIVPGERICEEMAHQMKYYQMLGCNLEGLESAEMIQVLKE